MFDNVEPVDSKAFDAEQGEGEMHAQISPIFNTLHFIREMFYKAFRTARSSTEVLSDISTIVLNAAVPDSTAVQLYSCTSVIQASM
jgi:hypothetical protein